MYRFERFVSLNVPIYYLTGVYQKGDGGGEEKKEEEEEEDF